MSNRRKFIYLSEPDRVNLGEAGASARGGVIGEAYGFAERSWRLMDRGNIAKESD